MQNLQINIAKPVSDVTLWRLAGFAFEFSDMVCEERAMSLSRF
jgi:hypothetical protein